MKTTITTVTIRLPLHDKNRLIKGLLLASRRTVGDERADYLALIEKVEAAGLRTSRRLRLRLSKH